MPRDLVLLHGGLHNASCWDRVVAALADLEPRPFGRVLQLDMPGCGAKRDRDTGPLSRDDVVEELNSEVARAGLEGPVLLGHSAAGMLLPDMAAGPIRYSALCFITTAVLSAGQAGTDIFGSGLHGSDPNHVGHPVDPATTTPRELRRAWFCLDMNKHDAEAFLDDCVNDVIPRRVMSDPARSFDPTALPAVTYIVALRNPVFPEPWQRRFGAKLGPDVRWAAIDSGHDPFFTHPRELAALLDELYRD